LPLDCAIKQEFTLDKRSCAKMVTPRLRSMTSNASVTFYLPRLKVQTPRHRSLKSVVSRML